jgi:hypothetical protein
MKAAYAEQAPKTGLGAIAERTRAIEREQSTQPIPML